MTTDSPVLSPIPPVPIRATIGAAMRLIASQWGVLFQLLALPSFALAVINALIPNPALGQVSPSTVAFGILSFLALSWLCVSLLRFAIRDERPASWLPTYQPRMWIYLGKAILAGLFSCIPLAIAGVVLILGLAAWIYHYPVPGPLLHGTAIGAVILGIAGSSVVFVRLSLAPIAAASGDDDRLKISWQRTRGQVLRMMTVKFLAGLVMLLPLLLIVLVTVLIAMVSAPAARIFSFWSVMLVQISVLQVTEALIYAHFYRGQSPETEAAVHGA